MNLINQQQHLISNIMYKVSNICKIAILVLFCYSTGSMAQQKELDIETLKQANNPLAPKKSFNVHNYVTPSLYGAEDATMNQLMFRYAQPVGHVFLRATMPFVTQSLPASSPTTGFGDFSVFAIYKFPSKEGVSYGVGPLLVAPTGSHNLGQGKWQTGLSAMAFFSESHVIQFGSLLQWQTSFAGDDDQADVSLLTPQMFFMWQIGGGTYLRSTGIWLFDLNNGNYNVPVGLGIGKVIKADKVIFNIFAEPQYSVAAQGTEQAKFQLFIGFNTQF